MKRAASLLIAILMLFLTFSQICLASNVKMNVSYCVTWCFVPERTTSQLNKKYVAEYYEKGQIPIPPDFSTVEETGYKEPEFEDEEYRYVFIGWSRLETVQDVKDFFDNGSLNIAYREEFTQEAFLPVEDEQIYGAVFRKVPKRYDIDANKTINISDVTFLLDTLSIMTDDMVYEDLAAYDVSGDGAITIQDVSRLLQFLDDFKED